MLGSRPSISGIPKYWLSLQPTIRPDIILYDRSSIAVLELTVCHETNLNKSREYKLSKYEDANKHLHILWDVTRSTLVSKLMYAAPVWFGFLNEESKKRCQAVLNRMKRAGYLGRDFKSFGELCEEADKGLFKAVT